MTDLTKIAAAIAALPGVESAKPWTKVAGDERIYIELSRYGPNGGLFGGVGAKLYWSVAAGKLKVVQQSFGGLGLKTYINGHTSAAHDDMGTIPAIKAVCGQEA